MSLRRRLFVLAGLSVLPAIGLLAYDQHQLRDAREAEVRREVLTLAYFQTAELRRHIEGALQLVTALAGHPAIRDMDGPACTRYLGQVKQRFPFHAAITVADRQGIVVCSSADATPVSLANQPHIARVLDGEAYALGEYSLTRVTGIPVLPVAAPLESASGQRIGVIEVMIDLRWLADTLAAKLTPGMALTVADRNMRVLLRYPENDRFQGRVIPERFHHFMASARPGTRDVVGMDGVDRILGFVPVPYDLEGIYIGVARERAAAFAALDRATWAGGGLIALGLVLAAAGAWLVSRFWIARPVDALLATAERLRGGDYTARAPSIAGDNSELGQLACTLDRLASALEQRERERDLADDRRAEAETRLRQLADTLEQRVRERTNELETANQRLAAEAGERRRAESALVQVQKLEAVGRLTGGIAHDFNNLLTAVLGSLELAAMRMTDERTLRHITTAIHAAKRGARLTAQMLAFARRQELAIRPVDVNQVIIANDDLIRRALGPSVVVERILAQDAWPAMADPVQLESVLLNLAVNARDAMPEGGELCFRTSNVVIGAGLGPADLEPGQYVLVSVGDTGTGMAEPVRARAFEPFFTTKDSGKGTGLGLAQVFGFARQSGGTVVLDSAPGQGTVVSIYLPRGTAAVAPPTEERPAAPAPVGRLRILLVDDDTAVRDLTREMLAQLGHTVTAYPDGASALRWLASGAGCDILLADFAMPRMNGSQLAAEARLRRPGLPILFLTGFVDGDALRSWSDSGHLTVGKPFSTADLAAAIAQTMDRRADGGPGEGARAETAVS